MKKTRQLAMIVALLALFAVVAPAAAAAPPTESGAVLRGPAPADAVYWEGDLVVLTGNDDFTDGCFGEGFQEPDGQTVMPGNGSEILTFGASGISILVFAVEGITDVDGLFGWLGANCGAAAGGNPPVPIATGEGHLDATFRVDADGISHNHNGIKGKVTTADGDVVHVSTFAKLTIGPAGLDLQQLRINYGG